MQCNMLQLAIRYHAYIIGRLEEISTASKYKEARTAFDRAIGMISAAQDMIDELAEAHEDEMARWLSECIGHWHVAIYKEICKVGDNLNANPIELEELRETLRVALART